MPPGIYVYRKVGPRLLPKTEHDTKQTKEGEPRKHGLIVSHGEVESKLPGYWLEGVSERNTQVSKT